MIAMDPSELLPIVVASLVAILSIAALLRVRRVSSRALRLTLVAFTGLLSIAAVLVAGASIFFYVNYTRHLGPLGSPDHRYVAITTYTVNNGTGVDQAEVAIRHVWSPYAHRIYAGPAQYNPNASTPEPALRWLDDTHLQVAFRTYDADAAIGKPTHTAGNESDQGCAHAAEDIIITCVENRVHAVK